MGGDVTWFGTADGARNVVHVLDAVGSAAGAHVAWCTCGERTAAWSTAGEALEALAVEHGRSPLVCVLCGRERPELDQPHGSPAHLRVAVDPEALAAALGHHELRQGLVCVDETEACARAHIARRLEAGDDLRPHDLGQGGATSDSVTGRPALRVLPGGRGGRA